MMSTHCEILQGHVIDQLTALKRRGVKAHSVVTSPPYWGLRSYGTPPQIWGGRKTCAHVWVSAGKIHKGGPAGKSGDTAGRDQSMRDEVKDISCGETCTQCHAWRGELGLEPTPGMYKEHMLQVFRALWDVLRDDGTLFLNLGDTYVSNGGHSDVTCNDRRGNYNIGNRPAERRDFRARGAGGLKNKDLVGIPWMIAFALRDAGWYLRSEVIWNKPCPMPESCKDRPTKAHEQIFILTKRPCYFYDEFAAREATTGGAKPRGKGTNAKSLKSPSGWDMSDGRHDNDRTGRFPRAKQNPSFSAAVKDVVTNRNWRDVWTAHEDNPVTFGMFLTFLELAGYDDLIARFAVATNTSPDVWNIASEPFPEAHYATFPKALARRCIVASTSEGGCCALCGAPLERVIEKGGPDLPHQKACGGDVNGEYHGRATKDFASAKAQNASAVKARILAGMVEKKTVGWKATCSCQENEVTSAGTPVFHAKPCTVLDLFGGSGTVGEVAEDLGRHAILIELLPANIGLIKGRTQQPSLLLQP